MENNAAQNPTSETAERWAENLAASRDRLVLLARSPKSVFAYWQWTKEKSSLFEKGLLSGAVSLKIFRAGGREPVYETTRRWNELRVYLEISGGGYCRAVLVVNDHAGSPQITLESNTVFIPRGSLLAAEAIPSSAEVM